jgi:hypothetical protein
LDFPIEIGLADLFLDLSPPCLEWWRFSGPRSIGEEYGIHRQQIIGKEIVGERVPSVRCLIVASLAARFAVIKAVSAEANVEL